MNTTADNQNNKYIKGDNLSFNVQQKQTGVFVPFGETVVLQPTSSSVSSYEYTTGNKPFILNDAFLIESHTEQTATGNYKEKSYILPQGTGFEFQPSLFSNTTKTFTSGDLGAIQILSHYLNTSSVATSSLTVQINFRGSKEEKVVLTGMIENGLKNILLESENTPSWEWFDI